VVGQQWEALPQSSLCVHVTDDEPSEEDEEEQGEDDPFDYNARLCIWC